MASITDISTEGGGLRVTYADNTIDQLTLGFVNGKFTLLQNGKEMPHSVLRNIIDTIDYDSSVTSIYAHLFGTASEHIVASADAQIGTSLSIDTWADIIWDNFQIESSSGLDIDATTGVISLPYGEWVIDTHVQLYETSGGSSGIVATDFFDVDTNTEVPFSFTINSLQAFANAPKVIYNSDQIDLTNLNRGEVKRIVVRVRSNKSTTTLGIHPSFLPAGSENNVGHLRLSRIG